MYIYIFFFEHTDYRGIVNYNITVLTSYHCFLFFNFLSRFIHYASIHLYVINGFILIILTYLQLLYILSLT